MPITKEDAALFQAIWDRATQAATAAAAYEDSRLPPENSRGFDCGFAWVVTKPATSKFVRWCKAENAKEAAAMARTQVTSHGMPNYGSSGWYFGCTGYAPTQSISVHQAAARAFAKVLMENNIDATTGSRLD